jgi:hypothetical protein
MHTSGSMSGVWKRGMGGYSGTGNRKGRQHARSPFITAPPPDSTIARGVSDRSAQDHCCCGFRGQPEPRLQGLANGYFLGSNPVVREFASSVLSWFWHVRVLERLLSQCQSRDKKRERVCGRRP